METGIIKLAAAALVVSSLARHSEAGFPASTVTQEMTSTIWPDPAEPFVRQVEMAVPSRTFSRSGFIYGLRLHFRR